MLSSSVSVFAPYPRPGGVCRHDDIRRSLRSRTCDRRVLLARAGVHAPWKPSSALIPTLAHTRYTTPGTLVPLTPTLPFRSFNWPTETARRNRQPPAAQINHKIAFFQFLTMADQKAQPTEWVRPDGILINHLKRNPSAYKEMKISVYLFL